MTVDAVITTHNRKDKVTAAIDSALGQTYPISRCIVVDDASTDGTEEKMLPYIESGRILYIYVKPEDSKGGNYARNLGIQAAAADYVAFLDDDDIWLPDKIRKQMELLESAPEGAASYCSLRKVFRDGHTEDDDPMALAGGDLSRIILQKVVCTTSTLVAPRQTLLDIVGFDENLGFWQEYDLCIRLFQCSAGAPLRENAVLYSVDVKDPARLTNKLTGWEKAVDYIHEKYADLYAELTADERKQADIFLAGDGIWRSSCAGDKKRLRHYLLMMFKATGSPKDLVKLVLNYGAKI